MASVMRTICTKATVPSCMRVPPDAVAASRGSPSAVARSTQRTRRSAATSPIDPPRKANSDTAKATRRPLSRPSPVSTASSTPDLSRARSTSRRYSPSAAGSGAGMSHDLHEPASRTVSMSSRAPGLWVIEHHSAMSRTTNRW